MKGHTHNIGTGGHCTVEGCDYVFRVPPVSVSIEVFRKKEALVNEHFNCEDVDTVIRTLEQVIGDLEANR